MANILKTIETTAKYGKYGLEALKNIIKNQTRHINRYQKAKAKIDPTKREAWDALSSEDKQKHLLEQFKLMASGQKTKEAVANELGQLSHNFRTIEKAAGVKYNDWAKINLPKGDILSQKFKVKSTNQSNKELIDPKTGYVMKTPSRLTKRKVLDVLENTKKLQPNDYKWNDQEFSIAFSNEYKKIFPTAFSRGLGGGSGGSNKYHSDRELAQLMLDFQGSDIKLENLPVTLRYGTQGVQTDITRGGIQSNKAAWEQTAIGDITTGLATKHAKSRLLDLDGTWNSVQASIYRNPIVSEFLAPIRKNVAGGFDIDHIIPLRFGGTNNKSNLRLIIKGSHMGETLPGRREGEFGMTAVGNDLFPADVKNKSAMEEDVFSLTEEMINLVINKEYRKALNIKQEIQTIVNNFKKTNPNTDFGIGMPHVVVKTGDNTASNVRLIDHLKLDDNTKKLIETDFIVYEKNLPNFGKSLEKTAEEVSQMYQPFIDAAGGELDPNIAKQLFEFADGGLVSIEEVIGYDYG